MFDEGCDCSLGLNGSIGPTETSARHIEHVPSTQRAHSSIERCCPLAQIDAAAEHCVASGQLAPRGARLRIRKISSSLAGKNCPNSRFVRSGKKKHTRETWIFLLSALTPHRQDICRDVSPASPLNVERTTVAE